MVRRLTALSRWRLLLALLRLLCFVRSPLGTVLPRLLVALVVGVLPEEVDYAEDNCRE